MQAYVVGKVTVATAGTPVRLPALPLSYGSNGLVARIDFSAPSSMSGASVFVGQFGTLVKATGVGVFKELMKPTAAAFSDEYSTPELCEGNTIDPQFFAVDAATSADGPYVVYWVN